MAYYLKMEISSSYHSTWVEAREVEFYSDFTKIPINNLSIVSYSSQYGGGWTPNALIDGNTTANTGWCNSSSSSPTNQYLIFKSTLPFTKIKLYNDSQAGAGYAIKECKYYTLISNTDPSRTDPNWRLTYERSVAKGNPYPNTMADYEERMVDIKYLIQDNNVIKTYNGTNWIDIGIPPVTIDMFKNNGMSNIVTLTSNIINQLSNSFKLLAYTEDLSHILNSNVSAVPFDQLILQKDDISLVTIENIDQISITSSITGFGQLKIIVSCDKGVTWKSFYNSVWTNVNINDLNDITNKGMTTTIINSLVSNDWTQLRNNSDTIRFGYYLLLNNLTDTVQIDKMSMTVDMKGKWRMAMPVTDYIYEYATNSNLTFIIYTSGDYKINY